jgi:phytoene dehydrogenase-like protein
MTDYDVIIVGGGPNGETLGAYLQRAGVKCLIVERRDEMGGGLVTEDVGGFRFNYHATYSVIDSWLPAMSDLFLVQYGASVIRPEIQLHITPRDGKSLTVYKDKARTAEAIGKLSPADQSAFTKLNQDIVEVNERIIIPWHYTAPTPPDRFTAMLQETEVGKKLTRIIPMSPLEILDYYGIKNDTVRAALIYPGCVWGPDPAQRGVGHVFAFFLYRMTNSGLYHGGSHRMSSALLRAYYESGGEVMEDTSVTKIIVKDGVATGVVVDTGREQKEVTAKIVASTLNPKMTFLELVGEEHVDSSLAKKAKNWQWDEWSMFMVHLGIHGSPVYRSSDGQGKTGALLQLVGYNSLADILDHWKDCRNGKIPSAAGGWTITSEIDPTQAPDTGGLHVSRMETQVPYELPGKDWNEVKDAYGAECIKNWLDALENRSDIRILKHFDYPPNYIEAKLPTMTKGSIRHGAYIPEQMGYFRPHETCSGTRTPIKGLYVAGASTHPGGMVTTGPGYIAAGEITKDLGIKPWWPVPPLLARARSEHLLP